MRGWGVQDVRRLEALIARAKRNQSRLAPRARGLHARIATGPLRRPDRFYDLALAVATMKRERLYVYLGHGSFRAYLQGTHAMSRAAAYRLLLVAEHLPRARARRLGLERSVAVARRIARGEPVPRDVAHLTSRAIAGTAAPSADAIDAAARIARALELAGARGLARAKRRGRASRVVVELDVPSAERVAAAFRACQRSPSR